MGPRGAGGDPDAPGVTIRDFHIKEVDFRDVECIDGCPGCRALRSGPMQRGHLNFM